MKLSYIDICGFRGFKNRVCVSLADSFTIIDGRNGVGKSTIFDAVEFALTGTISKYLDAKASGETVDNYIWWCGEGTIPGERYVEIGFRNGTEECSVRRTPFDAVDIDLAKVTEKLVDKEFAPKTAIVQLCAASIIRDEHIARLSLDLKEGERFTLLRDAIGAIDADEWIGKASRLSSTASKRHDEASEELKHAKAKLDNSIRYLDEVHTKLSSVSGLEEAIGRLQSMLKSTASVNELMIVARNQLSYIQNELEQADNILKRWSEVEKLKIQISELKKKVENAREEWRTAEEELANLQEEIPSTLDASELSSQARKLEQLVNLGGNIGIRDGHCPLCHSEISESAFREALVAVVSEAERLDEKAVEEAKRERTLKRTKEKAAGAKAFWELAMKEREETMEIIEKFDEAMKEAGLVASSREELLLHIEDVEKKREAIASEVGILDTISLNAILGRAKETRDHAVERVRRAEVRLGKTRLAETRAKAIHDAVRRAVAETLDQRLGRVLPLMSELYKRLRPHPVWDDIEYSVRGDVRRFLKLQVGEGVNPQFVFSSGQRRATGLAFLLSMNLSISWNRWKSILLDDPVQHVDDYRAIHLAEVLAHLCHGGQQVVCAVEDNALADLMCRRLSGSGEVRGKKITLGTSGDGSLTISQESAHPPLQYRALVQEERSMGA
ncbi:MAG: AAA family ATPase [Gammaproteobacteria bacterium]|nr:AAA family ATPase [Gammaproteobacteria bacterium]